MAAIRLLTYNVKMLPDGAKVFEKPWWEDWMSDGARATRIVSALRAEQPGWDVVAMQEVFDEDKRELIHKGLKRKSAGKPLYPAVIAKSDDDDLLQEDSGLFLATRHPIEASRFEEFNDSAGNDALADKGVLGALVNTSKVLSGTKLFVFSTHLQANKHPVTRKKQLAQLRWFMRKRLSRVADPGRHAVIVCGDFNVIGEALAADGSITAATAEYASLCAALAGPKGKARDLYRELNPKSHGATWDPPANRKMARGKVRKRLDYVFAVDSLPNADPKKPGLVFRKLTCTAAQVLPFQTADGGNLSDHFGISVTLSCG